MSSSCAASLGIEVSIGGRMSSPTETSHGYCYRTPAATLREVAVATHETTTCQCGEPSPRPCDPSVARQGSQSRHRCPRRLHTPVGALDYPPVQRWWDFRDSLVPCLASKLWPTQVLGGHPRANRRGGPVVGQKADRHDPMVAAQIAAVPHRAEDCGEH